MKIKNGKRPLEVYDIGLVGTYYPGLAQSLTEAMDGLRTTLAALLDYADTMTSEELEVALGQLASFEDLMNSFRQRFAARPSEEAVVSDAGPQPPEAVQEETSNNLLPEAPGDQEPGVDELEAEAEWRSIEPKLHPPYPPVAPDTSPWDRHWEQDLVTGLLGVLFAPEESGARKRAFRQLHLVEAHLMLMRFLGVDYVDPKDNFSGFSRLVNDAHARRLLSRPSEYFLKEPIRGYKNAEQNGKVITGIKVTTEVDPSKVVDYFSFLPDRGVAYAQRELKEIGLQDLSELQQLAANLEHNHPHNVGQLRKASRRAAETVRA